MFNSTNTDSPVTKTEGSTFLSGLTEVEIVVIGTVGAVLLLAIVAVILRVTMHRLKKKKKNRMLQKKAVVNEKNGNLLSPGTPSSQMSRSSSRQSTLDDLSDTSSDSTKTTYYSQASLLSKPTALYNYRLKLPAMSGMSVSTERINDDLISVISHQTTDRLKSLNLIDIYRENWNEQFSDITRSASTDQLCYTAYPPVNPVLTHTYETHPTRQAPSRPDLRDYRPKIITHPQPITKL